MDMNGEILHKLDFDVTGPLLNEILHASEGFSTPPTILSRIFELTNNPECSMQSVAELLESHPSIAARVLQIANSAYYGRSRTISSIKDALVMLGFKAVRSVVLTTTIQSLYQKPGSRNGLWNKMWEHSLATAIFSRLLAMKQGLTSPEDAYVAGLLHDIGKLLFLERFQDEFVEITKNELESGQSLLRREEEVFGFSHPLVGAILVVKWLFPEAFVAPIASHHREFSMDSLAGIVGLANVFATVQGKNTHAATDEEKALINKLGLNEEADYFDEVLEDQLSLLDYP
jgi:putative nucleotidyltransferase with HDIG domain